MFPHDETYEKRMTENYAYMDDTALKLGIFSPHAFYRAFEEFDNQCIEESLNSENMIIRIFAILDRRVGKKRLINMHRTLNPQEEVFNLFYSIRINAEGIALD